MAWLILGGALALTLFWAVGAYNRLTRLRSEVLRQWSTVDAVWLKWLMRFQAAISARQILAWSSELDDLQALQDASEAMVDALADAMQRSLVGSEMCIRDSLQNIPLALLPYHLAVDNYNTALSQAPASWLARRIGMRPALTLRLPARVGGLG